MKSIPLTRGKYAIVDDSDYKSLIKWRWTCFLIKGRFYAGRGTKRKGVQRRIYMHRQIMSAPPGVEVDHRNGDGLLNRRMNLRIATHRQNTFNCKRRVTNRSGFIGVTFDTHRRKWFASIRIDGKTKGLGRFDCPKEAARAWNKIALETRGEFAVLNVL